MWTYAVESGDSLDVDEVAALYHASTLGQRRPVEDRARFADMIRHANLIVTARTDEKLVGIARCVTDWSYVTYLSDLAVDAAYQRHGIGRDLIHHTRQAAPRTKIVLLSAPAATGYYPHIGFTQHNSAWTL